MIANMFPQAETFFKWKTVTFPLNADAPIGMRYFEEKKNFTQANHPNHRFFVIVHGQYSFPESSLG